MSKNFLIKRWLHDLISMMADDNQPSLGSSSPNPEAIISDSVIDMDAGTSGNLTISSTTSKKRTKNSIHNYYSYDKETNKSKCKNCRESIAGKYPTNLERHLSTRHKDLYDEFLSFKDADESSQQKKSKSSSVSSTSTGRESIKEAFLRVEKRNVGIKKDTIEYDRNLKSIATAFVANSLAYRLVEDQYIRKMFEMLSDSRFKEFPTRVEISDEIKKLTETLKNNIALSVENAKFYSFTIDLWSRPGYSAGFVGITCHFYDRVEEKSKCALLACRRIQQPHTAENIYKIVQNVLTEWQIDENKILRIVTDNGANIVKAFRECLIILLATDIEENPDKHPGMKLADINLDESFEDDAVDDFEAKEQETSTVFERGKRISCFAHNLMLAVKSVIDVNDEISKVKEKALNLINRIRNSGKAVELLAEKSPLRLIKPVATRWIFWYYTFKRLTDLKYPICEVCDELKIIHDLGPMDWEILNALTEFLQPFAQAVTRMEGEKYVTISEVYPMLYSLISKLKNQKSRDFRGITKIAKQLLAEIQERFKTVFNHNSESFDPIYLVATLVDPRYALLLDGDLLTAAKKELQLMVANYQDINPTDSTMLSTVATGSWDISDEDDILAIARAAVEDRRQTSPMITDQSPFDSEYKSYLIDAKVGIKDGPLVYWQSKKNVLPLLYLVAVDVLSIPATSAPVERVFSKASLVLKMNRHNLSDTKMEWEVMFKFNTSFH